MKTFNLNKYQKIAFYDGAKGAIHKQTRSMQNCYKLKMEKGMSAQEAFESCTKEYNNSQDNEWELKYA